MFRYIVCSLLVINIFCYHNFMSGYRDLRVYQLAKEIDVDVFRLTSQFPKQEQYSLTDQILRSAHSIVANIAEGFGRKLYPQEYGRFLTFAQGSCDETREHLSAAFQRKYCSEQEFSLIDDKLDHTGKMLTLLIRKVRAN